MRAGKYGRPNGAPSSDEAMKTVRVCPLGRITMSYGASLPEAASS